MTFIYITKWALTRGILTAEAKITENGMAVVSQLYGPLLCLHGEGREWHLTESGARERVEDMVLAKRRSLEKQLKRLNDVPKVRPLGAAGR